MGGYYAGDSTPLELGLVWGNLQPIKPGKAARILPEGYDTESSFFWYVNLEETELQGHSEFEGHDADYTSIGGRKYEVRVWEDWGNFNLSTDHNKYILVARAQGSEGVN